MNLFKKLAVGTVLLMQCACHRKVVCPEETEAFLYFTQPKQEFKPIRMLQSIGNIIDSIPFTIYGLKNGQKFPFSNLPNLPLDISSKEVTYIFERNARKDTLIIRYEIQRSNCEGGLYYSVRKNFFVKNTFNESDTLINCNIYPGLYQ